MRRTESTVTTNDLFILTLKRWMLELRTDGWYFAPYEEKYAADWQGPYSSFASVSLMIAREISNELREARRVS